MTCEGIVTNFHNQYRKILNIDCETQAYFQARVLKMSVESLYIKALKCKNITKDEQGLRKRNCRKLM